MWGEIQRGKDYALQRNWQRDTTIVRDQLHVTRNFNPWTECLQRKSVPLSFEREREVIECGWIYRLHLYELYDRGDPHQDPHEAAAGWYADISQGVATWPYGGLRTLCTGPVQSS